MISKLRCCGLLAFISVSALAGETIRLFPAQEILWKDPDQTPFRGKPREYYSGLIADGLDKLLLRPISKSLSFERKGEESVNVNALDEVPNSSWYTNRIGLRSMSPQEVETGPCVGPDLTAEGPWIVKDAKPNGANPGFIIKAQDGKKYLLKFDGTDQAERATTADVVGSRIYHAAGFNAPCNTIVFFKKSILKMAPDAKIKDRRGNKKPMTWQHVEQVLSKSYVTRAGFYRAAASRFLPGEPLGPWTYEGTRDDDPNDVVSHEDRRDLRGAGLLAAWIHHYDAREQNSLAMWIETSPGVGYVRHHYIDFGDSFGSTSSFDELSRRRGHSYYFDFEDFTKDIFSFGLRRPIWERNRTGSTGDVLGYFNVEDFDPERWHTGYPNPAFLRATERDRAWMARIISRFSDQHIEAAIRPAKIESETTRKELLRILKGRRDKIVKRYFSNLSPLSQPKVLADKNGQAWVCARDLAVESKAFQPKEVFYYARSIGRGNREDFKPYPIPRVMRNSTGQICVQIPTVTGASVPDPAYFVIDIHADYQKGRTVRLPGALRVHLYQMGPEYYRLVGLERPERSR